MQVLKWHQMKRCMDGCVIFSWRLGISESVSYKKSNEIRQKGKLAPKYIGSFEIRSRVGEVAYRSVLSPELLRIHSIFHVSMLRKYISYPFHVLQPQVVGLSEDLTYKEYPVALVDRQVC